ncbi:MAG TPA: hypothetical protein VE197_23365, partial [Mycobacterium sp.]|nr:hypothetical protein [Mycobacterium sp.]
HHAAAHHAAGFGLIVVVGHQWRGAAAIILSVLGWFITLRGLFLLAFPKAFGSIANSMIGAQAWWVALYIASALVGPYLTDVGWASAPSRPTPRAASQTKDLPRSARLSQGPKSNQGGRR